MIGHWQLKPKLEDSKKQVTTYANTATALRVSSPVAYGLKALKS